MGSTRTTYRFALEVRQAIKTILTQVLGEIPDLTHEEQDAFQAVVAILSNFEELLGNLFIGYFTKHTPDQKKYFYLAWLFWAYIRHKEDLGRANRDRSFYKTLSEVGPVSRVCQILSHDKTRLRAKPRLWIGMQSRG
jgi:hypothetical protein